MHPSGCSSAPESFKTSKLKNISNLGLCSVLPRVWGKRLPGFNSVLGDTEELVSFRDFHVFAVAVAIAVPRGEYRRYCSEQLSEQSLLKRDRILTVDLCRNWPEVYRAQAQAECGLRENE
jgi:hypothetical protein